jgi:hypothetical protein
MLGEGGKGIKLGESCTKVRLSQDRLPIEAHFAQMSFAQMSLNLIKIVICFNILAVLKKPFIH